MTTAPSESDTKSQVHAIMERIRPAVQADGGDIELVDVIDDVVQIRFHGACNGCPSSSNTLHFGIERAIKEKVPAVKQVVAVD